MEFLDVIQQRNSEHDFLPGEKISEEAFYRILESVKTTPSGYNAQPWHFLLIQDDERLKEIKKICYDQEIITRSGNLVVVLGDIEFGPHEKERVQKEWAEHRGMSQKKVEALGASLLKERETWKKR